MGKVWSGVCYYPKQGVLKLMEMKFYHTGSEDLPSFPEDFFQLEANNIDGEKIKFSEFQNSVTKLYLFILIVSK